MGVVKKLGGLSLKMVDFFRGGKDAIWEEESLRFSGLRRRLGGWGVLLRGVLSCVQKTESSRFTEEVFSYMSS